MSFSALMDLIYMEMTLDELGLSTPTVLEHKMFYDWVLNLNVVLVCNCRMDFNPYLFTVEYSYNLKMKRQMKELFVICKDKDDQGCQNNKHLDKIDTRKINHSKTLICFKININRPIYICSIVALFHPPFSSYSPSKQKTNLRTLWFCLKTN